MKKVIFVCLLTLSVCLSQPTEEKPAAPPAVGAAAPPAGGAGVAAAPSASNSTGIEVKANPTKPEENVSTPVDNGTKIPNVPAQAQNNTANATPTIPPSNETATIPNETKPADKNGTIVPKPNETPEKPADKKVDPSKDKNETVTIAPTVNNSTNADKDSKKNEITTPKGGNVIPTVAPVEAKSRAFDGPSFIGGIILTLGLLAIGFMGFKYYKNQTERNYHTL